MSFTPGPWRWFDGWLETEAGVSVIEYAGCGTHEAQVGSDDANLIKAAPDLYEALDKIAIACAHASMGDVRKFVEETARAAMAKARGE